MVGFRRLIACGVLGALVTFSALADKPLAKPTILTNPLKYLKSVPLGQLTMDEAMAVLGLPDKTSEVGGKTYLSFELGEGYGKREFVYEFSDGKLTDVRYHDSGPYNGSAASALQSDKKQ